MKKILSILIMLAICSMLVSARQPSPSPFVLEFEYAGEPIEGMSIKFVVDNMEVTKVTNKEGKVMVDLDLGYSSDFPEDSYKEISLTNTILDIECGFDACNKAYTIGNLNFPYDTKFALSAKPVIIIDDDVDCPTVDCPANPGCPSCRECNICPLEPDEDNKQAIGIGIIVAILSAAGGAAVMFSLANDKMSTGKGTGMKFYRGRNGELKILHKHSGIKGYHNPNILHRKPENHPKGMVDVGDKYLKNSEGDWEYKG